MSKVCYSCGVPLKKNVNRSKEHVPAKNLFDGFEKPLTKNIVTVPACTTCNGGYSHIDQNLRDLLAIKNNDPNSKVEFTRKGATSIVVHSDWKERVTMDNAGNVTAVSFGERDLWLYHIKNFKALFFDKYGTPIPGDFQIDAITKYSEEHAGMFYTFFNHAPDIAEWQVSGHEDVFKYILHEVSLSQHGGISSLVGLFVYHGDIRVLVIACRNADIAAMNSHYRH
ncbi:hypothetical protein GCM10023093_10920 [Nemorincola caseinilytica]|uniref:HNH endonuclease 5 domain-containing protein n=1 Tax=Nemorincola caseinilytica TaxID=2054315 RepID=A0ABP8NAD0_9BACT